MYRVENNQMSNGIGVFSEMTSRVFAALIRYQDGPKANKGGRGISSPSKVIRVPESFLMDLDTLISSYEEAIAATSPTNPRYDQLRKFLSELSEILPPVLES